MDFQTPANRLQSSVAPTICGLEVGYNYGYTVIMKTAISIPDATFKKADQLARRVGMSRSELYAKAVETFVEAYDHEKTIETLNRIYGTESSELDPVLASLQTTAFSTEDW